MKDPLETDLPMIYLKPGEMFFGDEPTVVSTLLGSCVSVTMFNRRQRIGAICHCQLPVNREVHDTCSRLCMDGFRYVECSIRQMTKLFRERKIQPRDIEVKVFGGADMFRPARGRGRSLTVGAQNLETAERILQEQRLQVLVSDVGGSRGRKIVFYTHTGDVLLKRLNEKDFVKLDVEHITGRGC